MVAALGTTQLQLPRTPCSYPRQPPPIGGDFPHQRSATCSQTGLWERIHVTIENSILRDSTASNATKGGAPGGGHTLPDLSHGAGFLWLPCHLTYQDITPAIEEDWWKVLMSSREEGAGRLGSNVCARQKVASVCVEPCRIGGVARMVLHTAPLWLPLPYPENTCSGT